MDGRFVKRENTCPIIDDVTSKTSPVLLDFVGGLSLRKCDRIVDST